MKFFILFSLLNSINPSAFAKNIEIAQSGSEHVELVELYSSESCSSCPPADEWISGLQNQPDLWKHFIPIVFHVDYWNKLGWKDKLSSESMTERQEKIASTWNSNEVYTPAVIVDGKEFKNWRESKTPKIQNENKSDLSLFVARDSNGDFTVKTDSAKAPGNLNVKIAILGMNLVSKITGGENSGKTLTHNFVVLKWDGRKIKLPHSTETFKLPINKNDYAPSVRFAVVAWVERENSPVPLQATGGYLTETH